MPSNKHRYGAASPLEVKSLQSPEPAPGSHRMRTRMNRQHVLFVDVLLTVILALMLLMPAATSWAHRQQLGQGGHALDASLQLGSNGYNRRSSAPSYLQRSRYAVGNSRSLYTVNRAGGLSYNRHNAFASRSRYRSTGYTGNRYSRGYHRRFRYQGRGYR